jgi:hypothetical protein
MTRSSSSRSPFSVVPPPPTVHANVNGAFDFDAEQLADSELFMAALKKRLSDSAVASWPPSIDMVSFSDVLVVESRFRTTNCDVVRTTHSIG